MFTYITVFISSLNNRLIQVEICYNNYKLLSFNFSSILVAGLNYLSYMLINATPNKSPSVLSNYLAYTFK